MRFENVLNWGNIITLVVISVGGLVAFSSMQAEVRFLREIVTEIREDQSNYEVRIRTLELGFGRVEERLVAIYGDIQRLLNREEGDQK